MTLPEHGAARACVLLVSAVLLAACAGTPTASPSDPEQASAAAPSEAAAANTTSGCAEDSAAGVDYFPDKVTFEHATGVTVEYFDSYKVVEVSPLEGGKPVPYVLQQCGTDAPALDGKLADAQVIEVPIGDAISLTTTNLPHFAELDAADTVTGVGTAAYVATPEILERIEAKEVAEYAGAEGVPNQEKIIGAQPDLLVMDAFGDAIVEEANRFIDADVPTVLNADFNEQQLLGRAEWLKFTALFLNREATANERFDEIEASYTEVADAAAAAKGKPTVFANTPFEGTWFMPGGKSFFANGIADANGAYVFDDDDSTYSLELDIETVLDKAADADIWLQAGSVQGTLGDLAKADERFKTFKAFKKGEVWAWDKSMAPGGGNAFFETGYTRADLVLSDLVKILHPEALPEHEFVFFGKVPEGKD